MQHTGNILMAGRISRSFVAEVPGSRICAHLMMLPSSQGRELCLPSAEETESTWGIAAPGGTVSWRTRHRTQRLLWGEHRHRASSPELRSTGWTDPSGPSLTAGCNDSHVIIGCMSTPWMLNAMTLQHSLRPSVRSPEEWDATGCHDCHNLSYI